MSDLEKVLAEIIDSRGINESASAVVVRMMPLLEQVCSSATQARDAGLECSWTHEKDEGLWNSGCGEMFVFTQGGPTENGMRFCCYCGNNIKDGRNLKSQPTPAREGE